MKSTKEPRRRAVTEILYTVSGRVIPGPPPFRLSSSSVATKDRRARDMWLLNQALAEAQAQGQEHMQILCTGMTRRGSRCFLTTADRTLLNLYLFGQEETYA